MPCKKVKSLYLHMGLNVRKPAIGVCNQVMLNPASSFFFCFVALHPKSTAMFMAGRSVHLTTLFPKQA